MIEYIYAPAMAVPGTGADFLLRMQMAFTAPGQDALWWLRAMPYLAGGNLDAPDEMPAGACRQASCQTGDSDVTFMAEQICAVRPV